MLHCDQNLVDGLGNVVRLLLPEESSYEAFRLRRDDIHFAGVASFQVLDGHTVGEIQLLSDLKCTINFTKT